MPNWWEYSDETEYRKRQADDLVRRYSAPAAQPSRPLVSFLDTQGKVTPGSVLSGALDVLQVPTEVIGKPLLGAITEAVTPGRQIHVDPNAPWYEQARQWYEGAKRAEEQRPELFGWDIPESVPLVGGTHIGEKFITENILFDPLNWLGWGGTGLLKAAPALAKAGKAAGLLSDVGKATDVLQGVGRAGRAIDIATTPLAWPDVAARAAAKAGKPGLALAARGAQAGAYLASAPALAASAPWMLVEPALRKAGGALIEGLGRAPGKVAAEAARAGGLGRLVAQEAGEVELPGGKSGEKGVVRGNVNRLSANAGDLAADYKARGMDRYRAWDQFITDRGLRPEMAAKDFYAIFDQVAPARLQGKAQAFEWKPTHRVKETYRSEPIEIMLTEETPNSIHYIVRYGPGDFGTAGSPRQFVESLEPITEMPGREPPPEPPRVEELPGRGPDLRPDEGIIARSAPRESYTEGVDEFFFEWRVRPATEKERVNYRVPYEDAAILELRRVDVRQGEAQPREWEIADAAKSAEELIRGYGSTDLMGAESLSPMLTEWQERSGRINELQQQLTELEGEIKPGLYERSPLYDKWQSEYKAELKRKRLYSAAKQNKAPAKQIQPIQQKYRRRYEEELGQIERRIEELRQQLSELQSQRLRAPLWQREVEAPRPEAPAREPWQMTAREMLEGMRQPGRKTEVGPNVYSIGTGLLEGGMTIMGIPAREIPGWETALMAHKRAVQDALARGEQVPPEVLAEYPDLAPAPPAPPEAPRPEAPAREPWQMTREEYGIPERPADVTVPRYPHLERLIREGKAITESDKAVLAKQAQAKKGHAKYLAWHRKYLDKANEHYRAVRDALSEGKPVPEHVLAEYPGLAPAPPAPPEAPRPEAPRPEAPAREPWQMTREELRSQLEREGQRRLGQVTPRLHKRIASLDELQETLAYAQQRGMPVYFRRTSDIKGDIKRGRSLNRATGQYEGGISANEADPLVHGTLARTAEIYSSHGVYSPQGDAARSRSYLITGEPTGGRGGDNEPLLRSNTIKVLAEIEPMVQTEADLYRDVAYARRYPNEEWLAHKRVVRQAVEQGKPVPERVLAEYPDLAPAPPAPPEAPRPEAPRPEAPAREPDLRPAPPEPPGGPYSKFLRRLQGAKPWPSPEYADTVLDAYHRGIITEVEAEKFLAEDAGGEPNVRYYEGREKPSTLVSRAMVSRAMTPEELEGEFAAMEGRTPPETPRVEEAPPAVPAGPRVRVEGMDGYHYGTIRRDLGGGRYEIEFDNGEVRSMYERHFERVEAEAAPVAPEPAARAAEVVEPAPEPPRAEAPDDIDRALDEMGHPVTQSSRAAAMDPAALGLPAGTRVLEGGYMHEGKFAIADETGQVRTGWRDTPEQAAAEYKRRVAARPPVQAVQPAPPRVEPAPAEPVAEAPRIEPEPEVPLRPEPPGVEAVPVQAEPRPVQAPAPEAVSAEAPEPMRAQPPQPPQEPPRVPPAGEEAPRPEEMPEEIGLQSELVRQSWQVQKKVQASLGENARRWWKTGWREFVDRLDALKQLSKDGNTDAYVDARLVSGAVGRGQSLILQHVMPVLKKVDAHLDDFKDYLVATRMVDIKAKRPKSKLPGGVSDPARALEEIRTRLGDETYKLIEDTAAEFRQRMDEITIKQALAVGRINSAQATAMRKMYPHYIPFYRQDFDTVGEWARASTMKAAHAPTEFSKRMKEEGSKRAIKDPLTSAFAAAINEQILIARHVAATSTIEALRNIDPKLARKGDFSKGRPELGIIQKRENGKLVTYTVPVEIARTAKATDAYGAGLLGQILRKPADILRKGATVYNPTFPVRNVLRDMFSAYWTEGLIPFTKYWWQGMAASFTRNDDWHRAAQAMGFSGSLFRGGLTGDSAQHAATLGAIPLKSFKDMVLVVPRTLERLNEALEQGTRNAVFLKAIAEGATDKQAAFRMRNCTLDFDMSGYATRVLNQAIPFLNPRIQGTATFFRVAKENPKLAFSRAAPLAVPLVLFWLWNQRFKDTAGMIPDYEYQANWVFQVGEGTQEPDPRYPDQPPQKFPIYFKIPKGEAVAALTAIPQAILRAAWAVDDRSAVELVLNAAYQGALGMSPLEPELSSLTTPVLGTALQMGINKDLYRGLNIVPQGELGRPPEEQYGPETSRVAVALGQAFGVSPRMIDFAIGDVTAGAGKSTVWLADLALGALGYNPAVPGAAARQQLTGVEQLAKAPVTGGMLGARANQQERIAYQKLDRAIEAARRQLYRNPEVKRFGMGINPPGDTYTVDGVPRPITPEQRAEIVQRSTPLVAAALDELVGREFYQGAADTEKRKLLDRVRQEVQGNVREAVLGLARPWDEDTARLFVQALEEKREYDAIPPYIGLTPEQAERGRATRTAMTNLARQNPLVSPAYIESIYRMTDPTGYALSKRLRTNPARRAYWLSHPLLRQFFGGEAPEAAQQMLAAMYPTQGAQAQAYGGLYG